jgi:hypothetical protein
MTWLDDDPPSAPVASRTGSVVAIAPGAGQVAFLWVVQSRWPDGWRTEIVPAATRAWTPGSSLGLTAAPSAVWISAVDRSGNQSSTVQVRW